MVVKCHQLVIILMLGILTSVPSIVFARDSANHLVIERMFAYHQNFATSDLEGFTTDFYVKRNFTVWKRNFTLWMIPSMYSIAGNERLYFSESYNKLTFKDINNYNISRKVSFSTIRHDRHAMPTTAEFMIPDIYGTCLYQDHVLSPFNKNNRRYYHYEVHLTESDSAIVDFKPRFLKNTQLISGQAYVSMSTGQVISTTFSGEYDMMHFRTETTLGDSGIRSMLPKQCNTQLIFKFVGNEVYLTSEAVYDCPAQLPDSLNNVFDAALMDSIRPIQLTKEEQLLFNQWQKSHQPDTTIQKDTVKRFNFAKDVLQDAIGDNLISSIRFESDRARIRFSPILNPEYISYSSTHGIAYKIKLGSYYTLSEKTNLEFKPWCGYNFKYRKFYYTLPFYFNYSPQRNGRLTLTYGNGNRISNSRIIEEIQHEHGDTLNLDDKQLNYFDDTQLTISNNIMVFNGFEIEAGVTYHKREPYKPNELWYWGKPQNYYSFAPMVTLKLNLWKKGPTLTIDYERGIPGVLESDSDYERWEFDGSWKHHLMAVRKLNTRIGVGFYTRRKTNYFVDYTHFRENRLPGGWDDDWSGEFQLLNSSWYNASRYYARAHISYDSPLVMGTWIPIVGHFIEKERFYLSALSIDNTRPYSEIGYGFSTRFVSLGLFASFLNANFERFGCKFTFELFRRW